MLKCCLDCTGGISKEDSVAFDLFNEMTDHGELSEALYYLVDSGSIFLLY